LTANASAWQDRRVAAASESPTEPDHLAVYAAPHQHGVRLADGVLHVEDVPLPAIAAAVGTPTYVYSSAHVCARHDELAAACAGHPTTLCYAVKANSSQALLRTLARRGAGADIVSGGELTRALTAGIPADRVVFSGVGKLDAEIDAAIAAGVRSINVESAEELDRVACRARALGQVARISLRVNPDIDPDTHPYLATGLRESKFGVAMAEAEDLAVHAASLPELAVVGVACHIGSQIAEAGPFLASAQRVRALVLRLRARGVRPRTLDLGGGLGIAYGGHDPRLDVAAFGRAVTEAARGLEMDLVLEPGRFFVGNAGVLLTRVIGRKRGASRSFVIVDAAMNDLIRPALYGAVHPVVPVDAAAARREPVRADIVGPVCECGDFLALDRLVPWPEPGELLAVLGAGAYGMAMASTYNSRPLAAEVLVRGEQFAETRPRASIEAMIAAERVPAWVG
jgi:diaminopimelate decarboxylase